MLSPPSAGRRNDWAVIRSLLPYLWEYKWRVGLALAFLVCAKLANVGVPLVMKEIIDSLDAQQALLALPLTLLAMYGLLRLSTTLFAELRDIVFVRVAKRAIRRVALQVFRHLHSLSLRFHLERQTGGLSRAIERGTDGIEFLVSYLVFHIAPILLEIVLVAAILWTYFNFGFAAVTFLVVVFYGVYTAAATQWRLKFRRAMNAQDSEANSRAIDSLLNFETVKYFGNEKHELE
ncbi:MAG TPA: ABC transporter transmembrane domain-containing protein, partial [Burkholderiales bacterium]|nr:ABC transporter transmembrane domain-containing protein [Burkholderiales bacterium]